MQTKDILKLPLGVDIVACNPHAYVHQSAKNADSLPEGKALVCQLVNYNTYMDTNWSDVDPNSPRFVKTNSDKTKRFLVKFTDSAGADAYRVIQARDIIALKSDMEVKWAEARAKEAETLAKGAKIREAEVAIELRRQAEEKALLEAVSANLVDLFGVNYERLGVDKNWIRVRSNVSLDDDGNAIAKLETTGRVDIPVELFLRMVERFANN
jgi:hypothetical protein